MITDYEKFKSLLDSWGVEYEISLYQERNELVIRLETYTEKVIGYAGFESYYTFNLETEQFISIGIYE